MAGLAATIVPALAVTHHWAISLAIAVALAAGVAIGIINAFFVVIIGIESIIVTLGMGTLLAGVAEALTNFNSVGGLSTSISRITNTNILDLPLSFYYGIAIAIVVGFISASGRWDATYDLSGPAARLRNSPASASLVSASEQ